MTNLLTGDDSTFTSSNGSWVNATNGANFTSAWQAGGFMRWTVAAGGADIAQAHRGQGVLTKPAVTPGQTLTISVDARQTAGTAKTVVYEANWFDSTQTTPLAGNTISAARSGTVTGTWATYSGTVTVPAGAAYMRLRITAKAVSVGDVFEFDNAIVDNGVTPPVTAVGDFVRDRWNGTTLIRQAVERWNGTALVGQVIDGAGAVAETPVAVVNQDVVSLGGFSYTVQAPATTYAAKVVQDPATPVYTRSELRAGDRWINDVNNFPNDARQRQEFRCRDYIPLHSDWWVAGSFRVAANTWKPNEYNIVTQFHQERGSPPFAISIEGGVLQVYTRGTTSTTATSTTPTIRYSVPFRTSEWWNVVIQSKWTTDTADGYLRVWLNGTKVIDDSNILLGYNDTLGPYMKFGIYRSGWTDPIVVEWANLEAGVSSLSGRVGSPLPVPPYAAAVL